MPTKTFTYNGAQVTIREAIGRDAIDSRGLIYDLAQSLRHDQNLPVDGELSDYDWSAIGWFVSALQRSTVEGELPCLWTNFPKADSETVITMFHGLMNAPIGLVRLWRDTLAETDLEVVDPND